MKKYYESYNSIIFYSQFTPLDRFTIQFEFYNIEKYKQSKSSSMPQYTPSKRTQNRKRGESNTNTNSYARLMHSFQARRMSFIGIFLNFSREEAHEAHLIKKTRLETDWSGSTKFSNTRLRFHRRLQQVAKKARRHKEEGCVVILHCCLCIFPTFFCS